MLKLGADGMDAIACHHIAIPLTSVNYFVQDFFSFIRRKSRFLFSFEASANRNCRVVASL